MKPNLRRLSTIVKKVNKGRNQRRLFFIIKSGLAVTMIAVMLAGASSAFAQARILDIHQGLADFDSRTARVCS